MHQGKPIKQHKPFPNHHPLHGGPNRFECFFNFDRANSTIHFRSGTISEDEDVSVRFDMLHHDWSFRACEYIMTIYHNYPYLYTREKTHFTVVFYDKTHAERLSSILRSLKAQELPHHNGHADGLASGTALAQQSWSS